MKSKEKRSYNSEKRLKQAKQTRKRILASAKKLFKLKGFERTTIGEIAIAANVSPPSIYSLFQSKRGILLELMDEAFPSDLREALVEQVKAEKSTKKCLALAAKISRKIYDAEKSQMDFFRSASVLSPEFKDLENFKEQRRYERQEDTVKTMVKENSLPKEINLSKARDILWAFTGRDMYRMLVIERGWSSDDYESWLANVLIQALTPKS